MSHMARGSRAFVPYGSPISMVAGQIMLFAPLAINLIVVAINARQNLHLKNRCLEKSHVPDPT